MGEREKKDDMESKAIAIGYLLKVPAGNVNASHTEGNVIIAKKVTLPNGSTLPYISGQALRRALRDRLEGLGWSLSEPFCEPKGQEVIPPVRPWEFIDEDLFGYLDTSGNRRRTSPVRVSPAVGLFPYRGDRDLGTRSFEKFSQPFHAGGNLFETEIYRNLFHGAILIELDRVGRFEPLELGSEEGREVSKEERYRRLAALLEALKLLWGGGRTARLLADLSPKFIAYARLRVKYPLFLDALSVGYDGSCDKPLLELAPLKGALNRVESYLERLIFGIEPGFFADEAQTSTDLRELKVNGVKAEVLNVSEAIDRAKEDLKGVWAIGAESRS